MGLCEPNALELSDLNRGPLPRLVLVLLEELRPRAGVITRLPERVSGSFFSRMPASSLSPTFTLTIPESPAMLYLGVFSFTGAANDAVRHDLWLQPNHSLSRNAA